MQDKYISQGILMRAASNINSKLYVFNSYPPSSANSEPLGWKIINRNKERAKKKKKKRHNFYNAKYIHVH